MSSLNQVQIIGNLGRDPELRYAASGDAVANFSVATTEKWKDKATGEQREATEWHRVTAWGKLGEICGEHLGKGSQVFIQGKLKTRKWQDDSGTDRYTTEIIADKLVMLGGRREGGGDSGGEREPRQERQAPAGGGKSAPAKKPAQGGFDDMDDDIPF